MRTARYIRRCLLACRPQHRPKGRHVHGGLQSIELLFVFPIVAVVCFAIVEFGCLWSANIRVKAASQAACRVATLPAETPEELLRAVRRTASQSLGSPKLFRQSQILIDAADHSGDPVVVEVRVPMTAAAPNLLAVFGFQLNGRELIGRTTMRKE